MATTNGFTRVWGIDGARVNGEIMRVETYLGTNGSEGVASPGDCKVRQLSTPGSGVQIDPGALAIRNRSAGARNQTYVVNGNSTSTVDIRSTVGQGARTDAVIVRVKDPQYSPWSAPSSGAPDFQYGEPFVVENVPSGSYDASKLGLGYSAYMLARIEVPSNTTNITDTMIKDTRQLAQPHFDQNLALQQAIGANEAPSGIDDYITLAQTDWVNWPQNSLPVTIPRWCTTVQASLLINGIGVDGPADVNTRLQLGTQYSNLAYIDYNGGAGTQAGSVELISHLTFGEFDVRAVAGTTQTMRLNARRTFTDASKGNIGVAPSAQVIFDVRFLERLA